MLLSVHTRNGCSFLEKNKSTILNRWLSCPSVEEALRKYNITTDFFGKYFGTKVIDFTFGVINDVARIGDCPYMEVMLKFFKHKNFALSDVFAICVNLKNSIHTYALESNVLDTELLGTINTVLDHNFMGVINEYLCMHCFPAASEYCNRSDAPIKQCLTMPSLTEIFHAQSISAKKYADEIEIDTYLIDELAEIEEETLDSFSFSDILSSQILEKIVHLFQKYEKMIHQLMDFEEIDYALSLLNDLLEHINVDTLAENSVYITIYTKAIIADLAAWRKSVFIDQNVEDIHYLDKTLLSSIAQLQILFSPQKQDETQDIEFF